MKFNNSQIFKFKSFLNIKRRPGKTEKELINKANSYIKSIKWIPWIRLVWIWNSVAMNHAWDNSDIDLFIVSSNNRLWTVRILVTFIFFIKWLRKNSKNHAWKVCLSFFCSVSGMNFKEIALKDDIYLYFWSIYMKPILDYNNTYDKFIKKNSSWIDFENHQEQINNNKEYIIYKKEFKNNKTKIWNLIEKFLKYFLLKRSLKKKEKLWNPYGIIINDNMLKFHNNDKRKEIISEVLKSKALKKSKESIEMIWKTIKNVFKKKSND